MIFGREKSGWLGPDLTPAHGSQEMTGSAPCLYVCGTESGRKSCVHFTKNCTIVGCAPTACAAVLISADDQGACGVLTPKRMPGIARICSLVGAGFSACRRFC